MTSSILGHVVCIAFVLVVQAIKGLANGQLVYLQFEHLKSERGRREVEWQDVLKDRRFDKTPPM